MPESILFKKRKARRKNKEPISPAHAAAEGANDTACEEADACKVGYGPPHPPIRDYGKPSPYGEIAAHHSTTDSPVNGASGIRHLDFQQVKPGAGFDITNNGAGPGDFARAPVTVHVDSLDAATAAGRPRNVRKPPSGNPNATPNRPQGGWGRDSTGANRVNVGAQGDNWDVPRMAQNTASGEDHARHGVVSTPTMAMKNAEILSRAYREAGVRTVDYR